VHECPYPVHSRSSANYSLLTANWIFTFSAKEKDLETGLSYFGSRYYSSDLSIWLSVDPMAAKFPHQSNYVYCSNNPIKLFDPNGEDEWEVNESGYIRRIHNDKPDRIYAVSGTQKGEWGERKSDVKPLDVDKSVMSTIDTKNGNTTFYVMNKRKEMNNLFEFLADNTNVEWTQISTHDFMEDKYDLLTSSHDYTETVLTTRQKALITNAVSQGLLDVFKHSHPNKYMGDDYMIKTIYSFTCNIPSSSDFTTKDALFKENALSRKQPLFFLRNGGEYYEY
jgi:RHS repeat-associated protein